jgi:hypothetical protein
VDLVDRVLTTTTPGTVTAVVGRPGSGVSSLLTAVASRAAKVPPSSVVASWERAPENTPTTVDLSAVAVPRVIGWSPQDLRQWGGLANAPVGTVVCVDYLQLIAPGLTAAPELRNLSKDKGWRLVVGVMAPRKLARLDEMSSGEAAMDEVTSHLSDAVSNADAVVVLSSEQNASGPFVRVGSPGRWSSIAREPR